MSTWLVIGISGVTNGGKTTIANKLHSLYPNSQYLCLDHFFLPIDDPRHCKAPGVNHHNWDCLGAIDVEKWKETIQNILKSDPDGPQNGSQSTPDSTELTPTVPVSKLKGNLLILDGFLALNDPWTASKCHLKFYFTLTKEQCWERRQHRHYDPPDIPGYFEACVWPEHLKMKAQVMDAQPDLILVDGARPALESLNMILKKIACSVEQAK